ncbi:MAG: hypothetical protein ACRDQ5_21250 [Sciscionella sp.]
MSTPVEQDTTEQNATETPYVRSARQRMETQPTDRTWQVPAHHDKGPVTITLRLPDITITDSEGRYIVVTPKQSALVGSRLDHIYDWFTQDDEDWPNHEH